MRPIDVDNLKTRLRNIYKRGESDPRVLGIRDEVKGIIDSLIDVVDEEPTIDLIRHGHWYRKLDRWFPYAVCSECGYETIVQSRYCPGCGAKMDEPIERR